MLAHDVCTEDVQPGDRATAVAFAAITASGGLDLTMDHEEALAVLCGQKGDKSMAFLGSLLVVVGGIVDFECTHKWPQLQQKTAVTEVALGGQVVNEDLHCWACLEVGRREKKDEVEEKTKVSSTSRVETEEKGGVKRGRREKR